MSNEAIKSYSKYINEASKNLHLQNRLNAAMLCLFKIKKTYPSVYEECLSYKDIESFIDRRK